MPTNRESYPSRTQVDAIQGSKEFALDDTSLTIEIVHATEPPFPESTSGLPHTADMIRHVLPTGIAEWPAQTAG